jgi:deazaflavin-dependent oxidoreductase (nitroreductase family)
MGRIRRFAGRLARLALVGAVLAAAAGIIRSHRIVQSGGQGELPRLRGPQWLRRFVTERFDPLVSRLGLVGGARSPWAMLEHIGRTSGTVRRTPVLPQVVGSHMLIPLPYGRGVHWAQNVLAAGHCRVQLHEHVVELDEPQVLHPSEVTELPDWRKLSVSGVPMEFLRLRVFSRRPGTLDTVAPGAHDMVAIPVEGADSRVETATV